MIDLSFILNNASSWGIHQILKESNYTAAFLSIKNETHCLPLLFL